MADIYKKLHLGCGSVNFPEWLNVDIDSSSADMLLDLTKPLPFEDCLVTHIFNEHFIEHISRSDALKFLIECRRVLSFNGVIRITTPNLRYLIDSYLVANTEGWGEAWHPDSSCKMINEGMRSWGHQFVYDAEELIGILIEAGFNTISFQEYRKSSDKSLCELEVRKFNNELIVEATKTRDSIQSINYKVLENSEKEWPIKLNKELLLRFKSNEKTCITQTNEIKKIKEQWTARGEVIAGLEQELISQAKHTKGIEQDWTARGEVIAGLEQELISQAKHINIIETQLMTLQQSLYGKYVSFKSRPSKSKKKIK